MVTVDNVTMGRHTVGFRYITGGVHAVVDSVNVVVTASYSRPIWVSKPRYREHDD